MICFIDRGSTDLIDAELLSLGAVTLDRREHYVELDMSTGIGQARAVASSDFVRYDGVLDLFGLVPEAEQAFEECFRAMRARGPSRHHAMADAHALRSAFKAIAIRDGS